MFGKKLHILLYNQRFICSKFHTIKHLHKVNLTIANNQIKCNRMYLKSTFSPIYSVRLQSNLSINEGDNDNDNNNNNNDDDDDDDDDYNGYCLEGKKRKSENGYAYELLRNSERYSKTVVPMLIPDKSFPDDVINKILAKNYEDYSLTELIEDFKILSLHARLNSIQLNEELHSKIFQLVTKHIPDLMDDQLWELMRYLELWNSFPTFIKHDLFKKLFKTIDEVLYDRLSDFTIDEILMSCDLIHHFKQMPKSTFVKKAITKIGRNPRKLSPSNYIHYMFILNIERKCGINMYEMEYALESIVDQFAANELGIVAMAFFKTRTPIRNPALLEKIIDRCIKEMDNMKDISLSAIMKVVRYSIDLKSTKLLRNLLQAFEKRIESTSPPCLIHAAHAAASSLIYEKGIIDSIVNRFTSIIPISRAKDMERMLFTLALYNYPKESIYYELIINQIRNPERSDEFLKFHRSLSSSLMYLCHAGIYPLDIIEKVMNHEYLREVYKWNAFRIGQEYFFLENSLTIEVPEYNGPFLPPKIRNFLNKKFSATRSYCERTEDRIHWYSKLSIEISSYIKDFVGSENFIIDQLLPHYQRSDFIICIDNKNNFISPKEFYNELPVGSIKYAPKLPEGYKWIVFIIASHNHIFRQTNIPCGMMNSKLRQIEKIGYTPFLISQNAWTMIKTPDGKQKYLKNIFAKYNINEIK